MNRVDCIRWCGIVLLSLAGNLWAQKLKIRTYNGDSDPSAAAAVNERYFVVEDDEHNILRVYSISGSSAPVFSVDVTDFLRADAKHPEADIEGAARLGERIYWITSHGRNKDGQIRPSRYRFFATEIKVADAPTEPNRPPQIVPVGRPYAALMSDMLASSRLSSLNLHNITRLGEPLSGKERQQLAPKEKGLNIEGLAVGPNGRSLWIGLRNPLYEDVAGKRKAIVIPLLNPAEVVEQGKTARFGDVILLDLDGRGIRSIDYVETQKEYWIVAGPAVSQADFALFRYHYADKKLATVKVDFPKDFTPEGLFILPGQKTIWFISDDGTLKKEVSSPDQCLPGQLLEDGRCPNKCLCDLDKRTFRVLRYDPMTP